MLPELFNIGPVPIRAYGLMLALAFFFCVMYLKYVTEKDNKPFEPFLTVAYLLIFGGILGGRLSYVLLHLEDFSADWTASFNPFASGQFGISGLNLYGGVLMAIILAFLYLKWKKMSVLEVFDYCSPPLALGIGFGRIGCFLNGCCYGTPTDLPWGITFPVGSIPFYEFGLQPIHPAQLYSALYAFSLFALLHYGRKYKQFHGQLFAVVLMIEALMRFLIESVRHYEDAMYFNLGSLQPTYNHVASILLFATGLVIYITQMRRRQA